MKKILITLLCVGTLVFAGCGADAKTPEDLQAKAIKGISLAINGRWDKQDKLDETKAITEDTLVILENEIKELEGISASASDSGLKQCINDYIEGTKLQMEALKTSDYMLQEEYMNKSEVLRKPALIKLVDDYKVVINENNTQVYNDFKAKANVINKESEGKKFAENLFANIEFKREKEYDWIKYSAVIENTSEVDFDSISYNVSLLDKEGVVVGNELIYIQNFPKGSKNKVEFSALEEHENVKIEFDDMYLKQN